MQKVNSILTNNQIELKECKIYNMAKIFPFALGGILGDILISFPLIYEHVSQHYQNVDNLTL